MFDLIVVGVIIVAFPWALWYGLEAIWKAGLWAIGRKKRRAAMPEAKVPDAG